MNFHDFQSFRYFMNFIDFKSFSWKKTNPPLRFPKMHLQNSKNSWKFHDFYTFTKIDFSDSRGGVYRIYMNFHDFHSFRYFMNFIDFQGFSWGVSFFSWKTLKIYEIHEIAKTLKIMKIHLKTEVRDSACVCYKYVVIGFLSSDTAISCGIGF